MKRAILSATFLETFLCTVTGEMNERGKRGPLRVLLWLEIRLASTSKLKQLLELGRLRDYKMPFLGIVEAVRMSNNFSNYRIYYGVLASSRVLVAPSVYSKQRC
jgi:hypothetical protein